MPINTNLPQPPANFLKTIWIIHLALGAGQVLFAFMATFISERILINVRDLHNPLLYVAPLFALTGVLLSLILFKNRINSVSKTDSLKDKLRAYQTAFIIRLALLEGPSLFAIVAFMLSGELFYLIISAFIIGYFIYLRPTRERIVTTLDLNYAEKEQFSRGDTVIS